MSFHLGYTADFLDAKGELVYRSIGREILTESKTPIESRFLSAHRSPVTPDLLEDLDAVISLTPKYDASSFQGLKKLLAVVRFGVGYDMVDIQACTEADVAVCITRGAVDYSVAEATIGWMLQLAHRAVAKDHLVRAGLWQERGRFMGSELRNRTLGIVGFGGIGSRLAELVRAFGLHDILVFDPYLSPEKAEKMGVKLVKLPELLTQSDFISIHCPLTPETRGLLGPEAFLQMKPGAYLINTARGGIVDEAALCSALRDGRLAGAAMDVFDKEPADGSTPLASAPNTILAPHCIAWTDEMFTEIGATASRCVIALAAGKAPDGLLNPEVLQRPGFRQKLARHPLT